MRARSSPVAAALLGAAVLVAPVGRAGAVSLVPPPPEETAQTETSQAEPTPDDSVVDNRLLAIGAGAVVSIVAFNMLAAPLGTVPLAGGALEAVPYSVALGSRLIAAVSAGTGAISAAWMYDAWAGTKSDYRYLLALGAGAVAGVAAGNYLALGELGWPPYYAGAGEEAAGTLASTAAQAASRVYVIATAVFGAWAADYIYRH